MDGLVEGATTPPSGVRPYLISFDVFVLGLDMVLGEEGDGERPRAVSFWIWSGVRSIDK